MKRISAVVIILFALMIVPGCAPQSENQSNTESPGLLVSPTPAGNIEKESPEALSLSEPPEREPEFENGVPLTRMKLSQALLKLEDVPPGWEEYIQDSDETDEEKTHRFLCRTLTREAIEQVVVEYRGSQLGPILVHTIQMFPMGMVEEQFQIRETAILECGQFETEGEAGLKWTVAPVDFPEFGENSTAMRATAEFGSSKLEIESVYFVVGDTLTNIQHIQVGGGSPNRQFTLEMARIASDRVLELMTFK